MMRFRLVVLVLVLCSLLVQPAARPDAVRAGGAGEGGADVVQATYDALFSLFYKPLDPASLLNAGWSGLGRVAGQQNLPAPASLPSLPSDQQAAFATFSASYLDYLQSLPSPPTGPELGFAIANAMTSSIGESHTHFLTPSEYHDFLSSLGGGTLPVGFGIRTLGGTPRVITAVAPNSPADRAGLKAGDAITAIDGTDLTSAGQDFAQAAGGPAGTVHTLTIARDDGSLQIPVTRGTFYFPPLSSKMLAGGIGYVDLEHFADAGLTLPDGTELLSQFDRQVQSLIDQGARGLVLDLRDDGGGDTLAAEEILGRFLPPDTETVIRYDERGHSATGVVAGPMLPVQLPLVVLVNGGSASSSEVVASTLREDNRAILVGEKTAGALATSEILPLPQNAGLQIAVAEQDTAKGHVRIDGAGFPVDIEVPDTRTADDYQAGRDPQLDQAVAALASAPSPPTASTSQRLSKEQISAALSSYMPDASKMPANDRLRQVVRTESLALNQPNEWMDAFGFGGRDPAALQQTLQRRGWIGSLLQNYNAEPLVPPTVSVVIDMYATPDGAESALRTNDFPDEQQFIPSPIQLGDGTVAVRGSWLDLGGISISWRRGNAVISAGYGDVPGFERMDTLVAVANLVDQAFTNGPVPRLPGQTP